MNTHGDLHRRFPDVYDENDVPWPHHEWGRYNSRDEERIAALEARVLELERLLAAVVRGGGS